MNKATVAVWIIAAVLIVSLFIASAGMGVPIPAPAVLLLQLLGWAALIGGVCLLLYFVVRAAVRDANRRP